MAPVIRLLAGQVVQQQGRGRVHPSGHALFVPLLLLLHASF